MEFNQAVLSDKRLSLREFTQEDWMNVHQYASQAIVCKYQPWGPNTEKESQHFVQQVIKDAKKKPRTRFVFAVYHNEQMIGAGEFNIRDFANRVGEIAYIIHPDYWGRGFATDVANMLIDFGFKAHKLHRIYATCDPRNIASSKVLEKASMVREGRMREDIFIKDGWRDSLLYSILEHEWNEVMR